MKREQQGKSQLLTIPPLSQPAVLCNRPTQKQRNSLFLLCLRPSQPTSANCVRSGYVSVDMLATISVQLRAWDKKGLHLPNEEAAVLVNSVGVGIMQLNTFWVWDAKSKWVEYGAFKLLHKCVRIHCWLQGFFYCAARDGVNNQQRHLDLTVEVHERVITGEAFLTQF